jgi:nucleotide-binding universal stress UspA family protein
MEYDPTPIIVGSDDSDESLGAISAAGEIAHRRNQPVIVALVRRLHLADPSFVDVASLANCDYVDYLITEAQTSAILGTLGVTWRFEIRWGEPARELMSLADKYGADSIVITRSFGGKTRPWRPSVATQLLRHWPHSLFVIEGPVRRSDSGGRALRHRRKAT